MTYEVLYSYFAIILSVHGYIDRKQWNEQQRNVDAMSIQGILGNRCKHIYLKSNWIAESLNSRHHADDGVGVWSNLWSEW